MGLTGNHQNIKHVLQSHKIHRTYINFNSLVKRLKKSHLVRGYYSKVSNLSTRVERSNLERFGRYFANKPSTSVKVSNHYGSAIYNINKLLDLYSNSTKPVLTYRMVKKKSFKRRRKVYLIRYTLFINSTGDARFLYSKIKLIYFTRFKGKRVNNDRTLYTDFLNKEVLATKKSYLFKKKEEFYNNRGRLAITDLLKTI